MIVPVFVIEIIQLLFRIPLYMQNGLTYTCIRLVLFYFLKLPQTNNLSTLIPDSRRIILAPWVGWSILLLLLSTGSFTPRITTKRDG